MQADAQALTRLPVEREERTKAEAALREAREVRKANGLPGVGGPLWTALWAAARAYSMGRAFAGHDFP
jgi:hypothetical protein